MKKVLFSIILLLFCLTKIAAQSDSQISQYTFFPGAFNPALIGEGGMIQVVGMHRWDYLTMGKGVQTTNVGVNMPFGAGKKDSHGAGIRFVNRVLGTFWGYQNAYLQYAYKKETAVGKFGVGIDLGFINSKIDGTKAIPKPEVPEQGDDGDFHQEGDPVVPTAETSGMKFDINIGVFYSFKDGYVGLSSTHVTAPNILVDETTPDSINTAMHLVAAYEYKIPDTKLVLKPHTLFKTDFVFWDWHLGTFVEYNEKLWGGISYRWATSIGIAVGLNVFGGLSAGLVYDLPVNRMINTVGSAEFVLGYNFEFLFNKHNKKYKSIRIL